MFLFIDDHRVRATTLLELFDGRLATLGGRLELEEEVCALGEKEEESDPFLRGSVCLIKAASWPPRVYKRPCLSLGCKSRDPPLQEPSLLYIGSGLVA